MRQGVRSSKFVARDATSARTGSPERAAWPRRDRSPPARGPRRSRHTPHRPRLTEWSCRVRTWRRARRRQTRAGRTPAAPACRRSPRIPVHSTRMLSIQLSTNFAFQDRRREDSRHPERRGEAAASASGMASGRGATSESRIMCECPSPWLFVVLLSVSPVGQRCERGTERPTRHRTLAIEQI